MKKFVCCFCHYQAACFKVTQMVTFVIVPVLTKENFCARETQNVSVVLSGKIQGLLEEWRLESTSILGRYCSTAPVQCIAHQLYVYYTTFYCFRSGWSQPMSSSRGAEAASSAPSMCSLQLIVQKTSTPPAFKCWWANTMSETRRRTEERSPSLMTTPTTITQRRISTFRF